MPMQTFNLDERRTFMEQRGLAPVGLHADDAGLEHALAQWIEADGRARVLVDDALRICWLSPAAENLMSGPGSILVRNGHLRTRENRFDRPLRELIDCASSRMSSCCVHDPKTGEHLVLTAQRLSPPSEDRVGLTLVRATEDFPFHLADLHSAFG